ncbi:hydroxylysine kinase isoform X1 [Chlorella sorokiniana]|uniref:Hydroxylysine kinase n=1 Tax=Chlorella sorokiniana TaxID=3076 RepID=A0A2P6TL66_CHLSO|nr:hydroxylysine kinase isoform X1 [Chlorella sorokiniana]|eukprot:PRW45033.1 hydroxylysine kinase isoform X1 [Chlorella sorokiniana]
MGSGKPKVSVAQALALAREQWGLAADGPGPCVGLAGYDDANFRVTDGGTPYVLKVHNEADSDPDVQYAEAQNALLHELASAGLPVPAPLPLVAQCSSSPGSSSDGGGASADGRTLRIRAEDGRLHAVRLLTYLPGMLLVDAPQSLEMYRQLGALLGRANRHLAAAGWDWTATSVLRRAFDWNVQHLPATYARVRPALLQLPSVDVPLLDAVVAHFAAATAAAGDQLTLALIHSDANERNVLVDAEAAAAAAAVEQQGTTGTVPAAAAAAGSSGSIISGLIDWNDSQWCWQASEPANAALYMMLLERNIDKPLPAAAALLAGYESEQPLSAAERRMLRTLCMGRLAQSLSMGVATAAAQPDNSDYLLGTQRNGWRLLRALWSMTDDAFLAALGGPQA